MIRFCLTLRVFRFNERKHSDWTRHKTGQSEMHHTYRLKLPILRIET
jgi:hypothetical protein